MDYPFDCVCLVTDVINGQGFRASGVIIGPHTILTASHVLWSQDAGQGASQVSVYPNYAPSAPTSAIGGQEVWHYNHVDDSGGRMSQATSAQDFAIIDVAADLTSFGWFGSLADYSGGTVHLTGYPANAGTTQTDKVGTVHLDPSFSVLDYDTVSASPGNSGGPLWVDLGSPGHSDPRVVGVVSTTGWAVDLTSADWQQIHNWETQDAFLWNTPPANNPPSSPPPQNTGPTLQLFTNPDGSHLAIVTDPTNQQPFSEDATYYTASWQKTSEFITARDGSHQVYVFDYANQQTWTRYEDLYDSNWNKLADFIDRKDGTHDVQIFDPSGQQAWSSYIDSYDGGWNKTGEQFMMRDGSHVFVLFGPDHQPFATQHYDAGWHLIS